MSNKIKLTKKQKEEWGDEKISTLEEQGITIEVLEEPEEVIIRVLDVEKLRNCMMSLFRIKSEVQLEISSEGIRVLALDPATVAMIEMTIKEPIVQLPEDLIEPLKVWVSPKVFADSLQRSTETSTCTIEFNKQTARITFVHIDTNKMYSKTLRLIDNDYTERTKLFSFEQPVVEMDLDTGLFAEAVYTAEESIGTSCQLHFRDDTVVLLFKTIDTDDEPSRYYVPAMNVETSASELIDSWNNDDDDSKETISYLSNSYSIEYLKKFFYKKTGLPALAGRFTVKTTSGHPIIFSAESEGLTIGYVLAPRTHEDTGNPFDTLLSSEIVDEEIAMLKAKAKNTRGEN